MSFNEPYLAPMSNYSNTNKGTPVDIIEAVKRERGYIDLDDPEQRRKYSSSPDVQELFLRPMSKSERKVVRAKAQREHEEALKNLAKQESKDAKEIAKQLAKWRKQSKQEQLAKKKAEDAKQIELERAKKQPKKIKVETKAQPKPKRRRVKNTPNGYDLIIQRANKRRSELRQKLESGEYIKIISETDKASQAAYKMQLSDIKAIAKDGLSIIKVRSISSGSSYLVVDKFARYNTEPLQGTLDSPDTKQLMKAITSGQMLERDSIIRGARTGARTMSKLTTKYGIDSIYTVADGHYLIGWIMLDKIIEQ